MHLEQNFALKKLEDLLKESKISRDSSIGYLFEIEEGIIVWRTVGNFIRNHLFQNKSVIIPGIGKFTFNHVLIPVSHNTQKYLCRKTPIFQISEELSRSCNIRPIRDREEGSRPQVRLNPSYISSGCRIPRNKVSACMKEIISYVRQRLAQNIETELPIPGIGTLKFKPEFLKMFFDERFLGKIEEINVTKEIYGITLSTYR